MENKIISELLSKVKQNKKYKTISNEIVIDEIKKYLKNNKITDISKQDIKNIRNQLHKSYASFQTKKKNKINDYLKELKQNPDNKEITNKLLSVTLSTKERLDSYKKIYSEIFRLTINKPNVIVDLGAGFNIFSYPFMNLDKLAYYSYDINEKDIDYINNYIEIMKQKGLTGKAEILNVRNLEEISKLPSADIIFLFKIIDLIDINNHKPSEELIKTIFKNNKAKFVVASFATKTLTKKSMNHPNRKWFELMLERNNLKFSTIKTNNEIFYIISR